MIKEYGYHLLKDKDGYVLTPHWVHHTPTLAGVLTIRPDVPLGPIIEAFVTGLQNEPLRAPAGTKRWAWEMAGAITDGQDISCWPAGSSKEDFWNILQDEMFSEQADVILWTADGNRVPRPLAQDIFAQSIWAANREWVRDWYLDGKLPNWLHDRIAEEVQAEEDY